MVLMEAVSESNFGISGIPLIKYVGISGNSINRRRLYGTT